MGVGWGEVGSGSGVGGVKGGEDIVLDIILDEEHLP